MTAKKRNRVADVGFLWFP